MQEIIIDRTKADVERARTYRSLMESGVEITEIERSVLERGCITVNTLNRIESNISELRMIISDMGYSVPNIKTKQWVDGQVFGIEDFSRIINNALVLRRNFFYYPSTPSGTTAQYRYDALNRLEKIVYDINKIAESIKTNYRECGDYECGGN